MNDEMRVLERIAADGPARRELLWLRAQEKEHWDAVRDLEHSDPQITRRLRAAGADLREADGELPRERRDRFGRAWDECYARHARAARRSVTR